jgi:hypothetical protein
MGLPTSSHSRPSLMTMRVPGAAARVRRTMLCM